MHGGVHGRWTFMQSGGKAVQHQLKSGRKGFVKETPVWVCDGLKEAHPTLD